MDRTQRILLFRSIIDFAHLMQRSSLPYHAMDHAPSKDVRQDEFIEHRVFDVLHIQRTVFTVCTLRQFLSQFLRQMLQPQRCQYPTIDLTLLYCLEKMSRRLEVLKE